MAIGLTYNAEGKVIDFRDNVDGLDYVANPNTVVWHDQNSNEELRAFVLGLLNSVPIKYLRYVDGNLFEIPQEQRDIVDNLESADLIARIKATAQSLQDSNESQDILMRVVVKLTIDQLNVLRNWIVSFKGVVAGAASLADIKAGVAGLHDLPVITYQNAKDAINALIDGE